MPTALTRIGGDNWPGVHRSNVSQRVLRRTAEALPNPASRWLRRGLAPPPCRTAHDLICKDYLALSGPLRVVMHRN